MKKKPMKKKTTRPMNAAMVQRLLEQVRCQVRPDVLKLDDLRIGDILIAVCNEVPVKIQVVSREEPEPNKELELMRAYVAADKVCKQLWDEKRRNPYGTSNAVRRRWEANQAWRETKRALYAHVESMEPPKPKVCGECGRCIECGK